MKRVLLLVVDGCTSRVVGPALERGELPFLHELSARGRLDLDCVSIFPSITPAATASIVTGRYPALHGIGGMSWWNPSAGTVSYFGDDVWTVLQRGIGDFLEGFLLRLNGERLKAPTLFELVERHHRRAASFNHLIFRGNVPHEVSPPLLLRILPSVEGRMTVYGPSWLCLGDFVATTGGDHAVDAEGGVFNRFGLNDEATAGFLRDIPEAGALPDFSVAYFADYDFDSHEEGPGEALDTLRRLDARLRDIFDAWGGIDRVLERACVLLTADHSHSDVGFDDHAAIELDEVLAGFRCADPGAGWQDGDELMLCPNMRAAEVYVRRETADAVRRTCDALLEDRRVDHVIWRSLDDRREIVVATCDRGSLRFRHAAGTRDAVSDEYGGRWHIQGDPAALDISLALGHVHYGVYPNALERLANGIDGSGNGRLWVTARPGYEFGVAGQNVHHRGGSHGTLHELDSIVPLLIAGHPATPALQGTPRIVDVAPICADLLGVPVEMRVSASHR